MGLFSSIFTAFNQGGIWMWVIFFAQVFSLALIAERVLALYVRRQVNQKKMAKAFEEDIRKGNLDKVLTRAQRIEGEAIGKAILAGTQAAQNMGGRDEIQGRMDEILLVENANLEKRTGFLAMIGNVGTLLGLLGTIIGLIESFAAVASVNPVEKATMLSNGISTAMHCTAYGLIMAIPSLVMYAVLTNRANRLSEDLNQAALMVFNWLSYSYEAIPSRRKSS